MLFAQKIKSFYKTESGRSMIEMLGVLAVIGVLSIAGIAGYQFAVLKFRANEIINELNGRAVSISSRLLSGSATDYIDDGFGDRLATGYEVADIYRMRDVSDYHEIMSDYFVIELSDIPTDVCKQLIRDYENPSIIYMGKNLSTAENPERFGDEIGCETADSLVDMGFVYRNDLVTQDMCSTKSYFDLNDFRCRCSGNTYLDVETGVCLCPAGHIWSEADNTCIESICPEGYFESVEKGCVPCSDQETYTITDDERRKSLCTISTCGRIVVENKCVNSIVNNCIAGKSFRLGDGRCVDCNDTNGSVVIGSDQNNKNLCNQCGNRESIFTTCTLKSWCPNGVPTLDSLVYPLKCLPCNSVEVFQIEGDRSVQACLSCTNDQGKKNRIYQDGRCIKVLCDSGEFMGADGKCYKCSNNAKVAVNSGSNCTACLERSEVVHDDGITYCQISNCPNDGTHINVNGSCYSCEQRGNITTTRSQCEACQSNKRLWVGSYRNESSTGECMSKYCVLGQEYPISQSCVSCAGYGEGFVYDSRSDVKKTYCQACGGYPAETGCFMHKSCQQGSEFRKLDVDDIWRPIFCTSCDYSEKVRIGKTDGHRQMCNACTSVKRFWAGEYCYRCDTAETPTVTTEEERANCENSCLNRTVQDGKCVLIQ